MAKLVDILDRVLAPGSGPRVARLFQRVYAAIALCAWLSLGSQVLVLVGRRGLLPVEDFFERARGAGAGFLDLPTHLWWLSSDAALIGGAAAGVGLAVLALFGVVPRLAILLSTGLYLGYIHACGPFLSFQWDNLLIETGFLAALLPTNRGAPWRHLLLRLLLFKLYLESGLAKWQSPLGDWQDGSAMSFYYETAPLPTWLGWYAHHLPDLWHEIETWAVLALETFGAFLILGPRRARLIALFAFTGFQLVNLATANYGFFIYLALALHLFLLDEEDLERLSGALGRLIPERLRGLSGRLPSPPRLPDAPAAWSRAITPVIFIPWLGLSLLGGLTHFAGFSHGASLREASRPFRVVNTYYLFTYITRSRFEPTFETYDGSEWTERALHHKPGPPGRAPGFVAPHQPRVDFRLWFFGIPPHQGMPRYVRSLLARLCDDPQAMQPLFATALPRDPEAVRLRLFSYRFTTPEEREETGAWWHRREAKTLGPLRCREPSPR